MTSKNFQNGNVLFLILIAVALFAALSYAVTQSTRSGGGNADKEKLELDLNTMLQYTAGLRQSIQRLILTKGCTDEELSAYSTQWVTPGNANNVNSPADKHCHIFDPAGAGVVWQKPPQSSIDVGGVEYVMGVGTPVKDIGLNGCDRTDLMAYTYVSRNMCILINQRMDIVNPSGAPPASSMYADGVPGGASQLGWNSAPGVTEYMCGVGIGEGSDAPELRAKATGCFYSGTLSKYIFYDVVLAR